MLMRHPNHGHTHVYSIDQQEDHEKNGWILVPDGIPKKEYGDDVVKIKPKKLKKLKKEKKVEVVENKDIDTND